MQERHQLMPRTVGLLAVAYPRMTNVQLDRVAVIAAAWRALKAELDDQERRFVQDNDLTLIEPYLAGVGCTTAVCAARGEPSTSEDGCHVGGVMR